MKQLKVKVENLCRTTGNTIENLNQKFESLHADNLKEHTVDVLLPLYSEILHKLRTHLVEISKMNNYIKIENEVNTDVSQVINNIQYIAGWFDVFIKRNLVRAEVEKILQEKGLI